MSSARSKRKSNPVVKALPAGTRLGAYVLRNVLGSGTFGIVYRAVHAESEDEFAVKEYLPACLARREGERQVVALSPAEAETFAHGQRFFLNEGRLLSELGHASLVKVHEAWEENGTAYMAMDLVPGRTLAVTHLSRGRAPREATLRLLLEPLLGALETLHASDLQHRDVAPQTIIMDPNGRPVLMDLDSPRRVTQARGDTGPTGPREGYAPLELYAGHPAAADSARGPWTDIYALGAMLHFMMGHGKPPPPAPQREENDRAGWRLYRNDGRYSLDFLGVVDWMLALQPGDRPQSVAELRRALEGKGVPPQHAPSRRDRFAAMAQRYQTWLWLGAGVVFIGAATVGVRFLMRSEALAPLWR